MGWLGGIAWSQPYPDVFVSMFTGGGHPIHLLRLSENSRQYTTLFVVPSPGLLGGIWDLEMDVDNDHVLGFCWGGVLRVSRSGAVTTLFALDPQGPVQAYGEGSIHQSGDLLVQVGLSGLRYPVCRLARDGRIVSTIIPHGPPLPEGFRFLEQDPLSGDFMLQGDPSASDLLRLTEQGVLTTMVRGTPGQGVGWAGPARDLFQGDFVAGWGPTQVPLMRLHESGTLTTLRNDWGAIGDIRVDMNGDFVAIGTPLWPPPPTSPTHGFCRFRRDGSLIFCGPPVPTWNWGFSAIELDGRRTLAGVGEATPGAIYEYRINLPVSEAGFPYVMASALSVRPGFMLGGLWIPLNPDPVFYASFARPDLFEGYRGTLDGTGRAVARFHIPPSRLLVGTRVFTTAASYGPGGWRAVSLTVGITIL